MAECRFCAGSCCTACQQTGLEGNPHQVGALLDYRNDDPERLIDEARNRAKLLSYADWETPIGIWTGQAHGSELVEIWYQGRQFRG
jgi:hypothetical protein